MTSRKERILTPQADNKLVWRESVRALERAGLDVAVWPESAITPQNLARMYALPPERSGLTGHPSLYFSVNFHGLDKHGEIASMLESKGVPVAVWCVDNPWNLLSGLRTDFWKKLHLFVTDPSFLPGLKAHGAQRASFLPLATDPDIFFPRATADEKNKDGAPLVFVGRSSFPGKERFFVGQAVPEDALAEALSRIRKGQRTDFFWWLNKLKTDATPLWPGSAGRRASLAAEESSLAWRAACLREAANPGLTIYGDSGWAKRFTSGNAGKNMPTLCPPLDYYTQLAAVYAAAPFSLNMMSFLLPGGLNQRHFDVWAAGGFCLMDDCPGLGLFPRDLTEAVAFGSPEDIPERVAYFRKNSEEKRRLTAGWRGHILAEHTYSRRINTMIATL